MMDDHVQKVTVEIIVHGTTFKHISTMNFYKVFSGELLISTLLQSYTVNVAV